MQAYINSKHTGVRRPYVEIAFAPTPYGDDDDDDDDEEEDGTGGPDDTIRALGSFRLRNLTS